MEETIVKFCTAGCLQQINSSLQQINLSAAHLFLPVLYQLGQAEYCGDGPTTDDHRPLQRLPECHGELCAGAGETISTAADTLDQQDMNI